MSTTLPLRKSSTFISPGKRTFSRTDFTDDALRELERHTAYGRAEQDFDRDVLGNAGQRMKGIEADLRSILEKYHKTSQPGVVQDVDNAKEVIKTKTHANMTEEKIA